MLTTIQNLTAAQALANLDPYSNDDANSTSHLFLDIADGYTLKGLFHKDGEPGDKEIVTIAGAAGQGVGYKSYVANLRSNGVNAPLVTVIKNELSAAIVWTRDGLGDYVGTLVGAFTANKTYIDNNGNGATFQEPYRVSVDAIGMLAYDIAGAGADNLQSSFQIEVRVYD